MTSNEIGGSQNKAKNLVWIDLEMTGLDTVNDQIIEIATIVSDWSLNEIAAGPELVIAQPQEVMDGMDEWNTRQHGGSGLTARVLQSEMSMAEAERQTLQFLSQYVEPGGSPMCGNSICQDRRFLARQMPDLERFFHYRNLDVSTVKVLAQNWATEVAQSFKKESSHRALDDIRDSIAELIHYRDNLFDEKKTLYRVMPDKPNAPATIRNREAIREVLAVELRDATKVLEIGSGTGQHAVYFAGEFADKIWQTSDRAENHSGICAWLDESDLQNVRRPLDLDVLTSPEPEATFDAVFSANTAHIMSFEAVTSMFRIVANCLCERGVFCLYGPFNEGGAFTSSSNEQFDSSLRTQDPAMGIRNIEDLDRLGRHNGMQRIRTYAMPANNQIAVWQIL